MLIKSKEIESHEGHSPPCEKGVKSLCSQVSRREERKVFFESVFGVFYETINKNIANDLIYFVIIEIL